MNILILGGSGFLAINTALQLIKDGFCIFLIDKNIDRIFIKKIFSNKLIGFEEIILEDAGKILEIIDIYEIGCVINFASTMIPSGEIESLELEISQIFIPSIRLLNNLAERNIKYIFISSGGTVYGNKRMDVITENVELEPISHYGYSKLIGEEYLKLIGRAMSLDYLIIRPSNPYGLYQKPEKLQGIIPILFRKIINNEVIEIWGDGSIIRDFVRAEDLGIAISKLIQKNFWKNEFNIGGGVGVSINQIIKMIETITKYKANISYKTIRSFDVLSITLDIKKIQKEIDYHPMHINEGLLEYYKKIK
jgi:UDP-glucose 4-epimerase